MTSLHKDRVADSNCETESAHPDPTPSSPSSAEPSSRGVVYWLAWLVTLSLFVVATLRIVDHDGTHFLIWINAFTRYVYLPAYACLAWAIWKRRWGLALANVAIVCVHVTLLAPDYMRDRRFDAAVGNSAAADSGNAVRVFFANVNTDNTQYQSLLGEIKNANPDVIILAEFSPRWQSAFLESPIIAAYPYGGGVREARIDSVAVFSRVPLKAERQNWIAGRGIQTIEVPVGNNRTLRIIGLHAPRPMYHHRDDYDAFWNYTIPLLLVQKGPLVIVGDCNATQYSLVYQRLTASRLRSAHQDRGRGYATTWPNSYFPLPPIRIDQAFLSPGVECLDIHEGIGRGSDHKPLILDVRIRPHR
ncbi:MAG TPA: endonuclease/exonuclease/phosphatase family protein [Lacipirellulaceae bacterium]|nr:endonuclease/exonuclease/phosphatase family protein [Lacipirellulaceae bacterium]